MTRIIVGAILAWSLLSIPVSLFVAQMMGRGDR